MNETSSNIALVKSMEGMQAFSGTFSSMQAYKSSLSQCATFPADVQQAFFPIPPLSCLILALSNAHGQANPSPLLKNPSASLVPILADCSACIVARDSTSTRPHLLHRVMDLSETGCHAETSRSSEAEILQKRVERMWILSPAHRASAATSLSSFVRTALRAAAIAAYKEVARTA